MDTHVSVNVSINPTDSTTPDTLCLCLPEGFTIPVGLVKLVHEVIAEEWRITQERTAAVHANKKEEYFLKERIRDLEV
jgi:hypothetical protein